MCGECECVSASASVASASASAEPRASDARRWLAAGWRRRQRTRKPSGMHGGAARSRMASVYWHNAFCPNPSLAPRAPACQARPEASERARAGMGAERSTMSCVSKENLRRLICEGRVCRASVCEVRGPYQRQCQYQTRHRKPGRIITDARQELPAARCPLPVARRRHPPLLQALEGSPGSRKDASGGGCVDRDPQQESQVPTLAWWAGFVEMR